MNRLSESPARRSNASALEKRAKRRGAATIENPISSREGTIEDRRFASDRFNDGESIARGRHVRLRSHPFSIRDFLEKHPQIVGSRRKRATWWDNPGLETTQERNDAAGAGPSYAYFPLPARDPGNPDESGTSEHAVEARVVEGVAGFSP